ncbi:hypothetical protein Leryth_024319 [Lithospermum erythrorhizon]|nr:hypothetical protein Leryth_024319 [Lithospermum erythrorhizon]
MFSQHPIKQLQRLVKLPIPTQSNQNRVKRNITHLNLGILPHSLLITIHRLLLHTPQKIPFHQSSIHHPVQNLPTQFLLQLLINLKNPIAISTLGSPHHQITIHNRISTKPFLQHLILQLQRPLNFPIIDKPFNQDPISSGGGVNGGIVNELLIMLQSNVSLPAINISRNEQVMSDHIRGDPGLGDEAVER